MGLVADLPGPRGRNAPGGDSLGFVGVHAGVYRVCRVSRVYRVGIGFLGFLGVAGFCMVLQGRVYRVSRVL